MSQAVFRFANGSSRTEDRSLGGIVARFVRYVATQLRLDRDLAALQRLDGRELADIGLGRGELAHAVRFGRTKQRRVAPEFGHRVSIAGSFADMPVGMTEWR